MSTLFTPFKLTNGTLIKNRIVKSAMSDNLGNGAGIPTPEQISLYEQWAKGGVGVLIVGEVQISPHYPESAGNLVVTKDTFSPEFRQLTETVTSKGCHIWAQLGHAGALSDPSISSPAGPSEIQSDMINARELPQSYLEELPNLYARSALRCKQLGFSGVQIHAAHGFLLSQILSPLFNKRKDKFGGSIHNRFTLIENIIESVRDKVGSRFPVSLKLNCSDFLEGGFTEQDALDVLGMLNTTSVNLVEISGGTYFPSAPVKQKPKTKPYYIEFIRYAKAKFSGDLILTGGIEGKRIATSLLANGWVDLIGLARPFIIEPALPIKWRQNSLDNINLPRFDQSKSGDVTTSYLVMLYKLSQGNLDHTTLNDTDLLIYQRHQQEKRKRWLNRFFRQKH